MRRPWVLPVMVLSLWTGTLAPECLGSMGGSVGGSAASVAGEQAPLAAGAETAHHAHSPKESASQESARQGSPETQGHDHDRGPSCGPSTACGSGAVPTVAVTASFVPIPPLPRPEAGFSLDPDSVVLSTEPPPPRLPA